MNIPNYNVTIDPTEPARAVADPEIAEVTNLVSGDVLAVTDLITGQRYDVLVETRGRILDSMKSGTPLYSCALCSIPVYLVSSPEKRFFFRHRMEDGRCPARTRNVLTEAEIRARKYRGLRESEAHKKIKHLIERSLAADPRFRTDSIAQERRWRSELDPSQWRQPDVQAICVEERFAFEAQLSTTFLDVVVDRRRFYREQNALLIWILGCFDPNYRRMTTDDLLFSNNSNIFVVDEDTTRLSEEKRTFHLRCHYRQITCDQDNVVESWGQEIVSFHELTKDVENQQIYLIDCKAEKVRLAAESDRKLRNTLISLWTTIEFPYDPRPELIAQWRAARLALATRGILIPGTPHQDGSFRGMMHGLLSAQYGKPFGWDFKALVEVAHRIAEAYPQHLLAFGYALEHYGHKSVLESQDTSGKWKAKCDIFRTRIKAREQKYLPDQKWHAALSFLFPEVGDRVSKFLNYDVSAY